MKYMELEEKRRKRRLLLVITLLSTVILVGIGVVYYVKGSPPVAMVCDCHKQAAL